eukprot:TRINITY_DN36752_c0_g1_i1.p3 TRINITY_DN36752_c0_g1~~TRINITY_DN36752_c0_g1_i1.p3  ORF type:complete len:101 (+),score=17.39 TRINITY_DN36752_c0_g1_i1:45-347(+)
MLVYYFVCLFFCLSLFFFFKQKTAYEMLRSLVGSEMCIRDRLRRVWGGPRWSAHPAGMPADHQGNRGPRLSPNRCRSAWRHLRGSEQSVAPDPGQHDSPC